jgi:hypothetical protein
MRRLFDTLFAAILSAAVALLLNPAPTLGAEAHAARTRRPRDLATAYEAIYAAAYSTGFTTKDPIARGRHARRLAVDAIANSVAGDGGIAQLGHTPADKAAGKAAAAALNAGPPGFQNCRVMFAYRDAYWAAYDALGGDKTASPDQAASIAAFAVASAVPQQIAADESAGGRAAEGRDAAKGDDDKPLARDQHPAAYDAAYKAAYRIMGTGSKTPEYDESTAAYEAAKSQLIQDHVEWNQRLVAELAIRALFNAAHDWTAKQPRHRD